MTISVRCYVWIHEHNGKPVSPCAFNSLEVDSHERAGIVVIRTPEGQTYAVDGHDLECAVANAGNVGKVAEEPDAS